MKTRIGMMTAAFYGFLVATSMGQNPVITSVQGNGQLSWTNAVNSNALYRVEWAAHAGGPWYRNFDNIGSLDGGSATGFTVSVPMFYRVVMSTNRPPVDMKWIDEGDIQIGDPGIAEPVHTTRVSGFWIDTKEVTVTLWHKVHAWSLTNGYSYSAWAPSTPTNSGKPILNVNWYDAVKWCNARSEMEGLEPVYRYIPTGFVFLAIFRTGEINISNSWVNWDANGYRLPTEAEWEKAARGGRQGWLFPWARNTITHDDAAYYSTNHHSYDVSLTSGHHPEAPTGGVLPVGSFPANGFGLFDMAGNVWEWCWDWWQEPYSGLYTTNPPGPLTGTFRVMRGGGTGHFIPHALPCAARGQQQPGLANQGVGFRTVRRGW